MKSVRWLLQEDLSNISSSGETKPLPHFSQSMLSVPNGGCMDTSPQITPTVLLTGIYTNLSRPLSLSHLKNFQSGAWGACVHMCVCVRFPPQSSMPCDRVSLT